jgi:GNAT superfamily N-acetyltransferase
VIREVSADDAEARRLVEAYFAELRVRLGGFVDPSRDELRTDVAPDARGRGVARTLLAALEHKARALGCTRIVLDTAAPLVEAARLYLREGYAEIDRYNDNPHAARWFGKVLAP